MFHIKDKQNNSAIIMAGLVILLCLVSLTGATLALFTSNPDDGTIGVIATSGNVKVDIVDSVNELTLVGKVLQFETDNEDGVLFEPGATFYTQGFKAKNVGDVPINFRLYISNDDTIDMQKFEEAFEFYITTDPLNPNDSEKLISYTDRLEVGESSETYYLLIKMKETATNEFQGRTYTGIGITVCAVQGNVNIEGLEYDE